MAFSEVQGVRGSGFRGSAGMFAVTPGLQTL